MTTQDDLHRLIWLLTQLDEVKAAPPADQELGRALSEPIRALRGVIDDTLARLKAETRYEAPRRSESFEAVRQVARNPYAWPGGYPVVLVMADSEILCSACVSANYRLILESTRDNAASSPGDGWNAQGSMVLEGSAADYGETICAHCGVDVLEVEPDEPGTHSGFQYVAEYVPNGSEEPETATYTRAEALDRLDGWVDDPGAALDALDLTPGESFRLTAFAYYRAEKVTS